jgi:hypothetical protein
MHLSAIGIYTLTTNHTSAAFRMIFPVLLSHQEACLGDHDKIIVQFNKFAIPMTFKGHAHHYYWISSPLPALKFTYRRPPASLPAN